MILRGVDVGKQASLPFPAGKFEGIQLGRQFLKRIIPGTQPTLDGLDGCRWEVEWKTVKAIQSKEIGPLQVNYLIEEESQGGSRDQGDVTGKKQERGADLKAHRRHNSRERPAMWNSIPLNDMNWMSGGPRRVTHALEVGDPLESQPPLVAAHPAAGTPGKDGNGGGYGRGTWG